MVALSEDTSQCWLIIKSHRDLGIDLLLAGADSELGCCLGIAPDRHTPGEKSCLCLCSQVKSVQTMLAIEMSMSELFWPCPVQKVGVDWPADGGT